MRKIDRQEQISFLTLKIRKTKTVNKLVYLESKVFYMGGPSHFLVEKYECYILGPLVQKPT